MLLLKQVESFLIHASFLFLVSQLRGVVDGLATPFSAHDNDINHQNKTGPMINATEIDGNDLHELEPQQPTAPATSENSTKASLYPLSGLNGTETLPLRNNSPTAFTVPSVSQLQSTLYTRTTSIPPSVKKGPSFKLNVLEYVLVPVGVILLVIVSCCLVRYIQKVRRKRRLERELLHQYSYPNSEADEMENDQNITEIDSIVNSQFVMYSDYNDKALADEIPQVTVTAGEGTMSTVKQDTEDLEHSTSFNG